MREKLKKLIKDLLQDGQGKWSLSRLTSAACVLSVLTWISYLVFKTGKLPDLTAPSLWVGAGGAHYAGGKYLDLVKSKLGIGGGDDPKQS